MLVELNRDSKEKPSPLTLFLSGMSLEAEYGYSKGPPNTNS
jgi:hypothetical protein